MRANLVFLTRRGDRATLRRQMVVKTETLRLGRGADCELHLPDPRVLLVQASVHRRPDGFWIEAASQAPITVNGVVVEAAALKVGDQIQLGPYAILVESAEGGNIDLAIELVYPLGDGLARLRGSASARIDRLVLSRRQWAWLAVVAMLVVGLVAPIATFYLSRLQPAASGHGQMVHSGAAPAISRFWLTGPMSRAHGPLGDNCTACHTVPFAAVSSTTCLQCHSEVTQHADLAANPHVDLAGQRCTNCHIEHKGDAGLLAAGAAACTACHGTGPAPITGFANGHPSFRVTLPDSRNDTSLLRVLLSGAEKPIEQSGLRFPHDRHLKPNLRIPNGETVSLDCGSCHRREAKSSNIEPVRFVSDCQGCHSLSFDSALPGRRLPHGKPDTLRQFLEETYLAAAISGEYEAPDRPDAALLRRIPGLPALEDQSDKRALRDWAAERAQQAMAGRLVRGQCGECHATGPADGGGFSVLPVRQMNRFFPAARFDHEPHKAVRCASCHDAARSANATDVLLPDIGTCRTCHGDPGHAGKVASGCASCHDFHRGTLPVMNTPQH